jgi:putative sugar O-methyltransferase
VLEHVTPAQGAEYLDLALRRSPELASLLSRVAGNDSVGAPVRAEYGEHGAFSPTTLRYFKVLADLVSLFGPLDGFEIAEIGGGYGGQAFVCAQAAPGASFTLVDLPETAALQQKYLERLGVANVRAIAADELDSEGTPQRFDLTISNYAFSELTRPTQQMYLDRILRRSQRGYLTLNRHTPHAYRSFTTPELLAALPGSRLLPTAEEVFVDRKAQIQILAWGTE